MATFKQAIEKALQAECMSLTSINQNLLEVSSQTKKKAAFVKFAAPEELARGLMHRKRLAFVLHIDADEMDAIVKKLDDDESALVSSETESA